MRGLAIHFGRASPPDARTARLEAGPACSACVEQAARWWARTRETKLVLNGLVVHDDAAPGLGVCRVEEMQAVGCAVSGMQMKLSDPRRRQMSCTRSTTTIDARRSSGLVGQR